MDSTLLKGLRVLEALICHGAERTAAELAVELGLVRSNAHRTLQTLCHAGFVEQSPGSARYRPTLRLWELGNLVTRTLTIRDVARPALERLARQTGETVLLAALDGLDIIYLDKINSTRAVGTYSQIGARAPAAATGIGKALLAHAPASLLSQLPDPLERHTHTTITDRNALLQDLAKARSRGYAVNVGEWRSEVNGVASAILGWSGQPVAALAVSGPNTRLDSKRRRELGSLVAAAASEVAGQAFGERPRVADADPAAASAAR
ncbi:MAG: IclR family transcriptional regulator [Lautropia sp.]